MVAGGMSTLGFLAAGGLGRRVRTLRALAGALELMERELSFRLPPMPELLEGLEPDPEAGSYMAYYAPTPENEAKAKKFVEIIASLVENEEELCRIVREEGDEIEWD